MLTIAPMKISRSRRIMMPALRLLFVAWREAMISPSIKAD